VGLGSTGEAWAKEDPVEDMFRCPEARGSGKSKRKTGGRCKR
jgi:hypothetical protein